MIAAALWATALALWVSPRPATAAAPKIITAERFVVRDADGTQRASLDTDGLLVLRNDAADSTAIGASSIAIRAGGGLRVLLQGNPAGGGLFTISDKSDMRWLLAVSGDGNNTAHFGGRGGVVDFDLAKAGPTVMLKDKERRPRAILGAFTTPDKRIERPESSLVLIDSGGLVVWKAP